MTDRSRADAPAPDPTGGPVAPPNDVSPANDIAPAVLEREMRLIREAIAMVAGGGSPRVTVAGIRFGDAILEPARAWALEAGVRINPLWRTDESGLDISVEPGPIEPIDLTEPGA